MKNDLLTLHDTFCEEGVVRNLRPSTIKWWRESLMIFVRYFPEGEVTSVDDLTTQRLWAYFSDRRKAGWSSHTYSNRYRALAAFFKWCVKKHHLLASPLDEILAPKVEATLPKPISPGDAEFLLRYVFHCKYTTRLQAYRNRALFGVMLLAGLRRTEALNPRVEHVDVRRRWLVVRNGKGGKDRALPIGERLNRFLAEYLKERAQAGRTCPALFTNATRDEPLKKDGVQRLVRSVRQGAGIDFSCHRLRHTFCTELLKGGAEIRAVQKMMGHSQIRTTEGYAALSARQLYAEMDKHALGRERSRLRELDPYVETPYAATYGVEYERDQLRDCRLYRPVVDSLPQSHDLCTDSRHTQSTRAEGSQETLRLPGPESSVREAVALHLRSRAPQQPAQTTAEVFEALRGRGIPRLSRKNVNEALQRLSERDIGFVREGTRYPNGYRYRFQADPPGPTRTRTCRSGRGFAARPSAPGGHTASWSRCCHGP